MNLKRKEIDIKLNQMRDKYNIRITLGSVPLQGKIGRIKGKLFDIFDILTFKLHTSFANNEST